jgi:SAM-dependent methyltransferase
MVDFPWPPLPGTAEKPVWNGRGFAVAGRALPFLAYSDERSGWTGELTAFHEAHGGQAHAIDVASRERAVAELGRHALREDAVVLEVGASSGYLLKELRARLPRASVIGADCFPDSLARLARETPDLPLMQFDLVRCPLPDGCLDAVVLLNVLEHIEDDLEALRQVRRILKPGGIAVIEVPAGPHLYDFYDKELKHYRRYAMAGLRTSAANAGLRVVSASHLGFFAYPPFYLVKKMNQRSPEGGREKTAREIEETRDNLLLKAAFRLERALASAVSFPFGIRCVMTCEKVLAENAPKTQAFDP